LLIAKRQPTFLLVTMALLGSPAPGALATTQEPAVAARPGDMTLDQFLDRVMMAESGGRDHLRNPMSTAVGPFQLLEGLFLELAQRHFAAETAQLSATQILALRTDRAFARRAAAAFTQDNAAHLAREGLPTTFQNLRLAYFAGPAGAVRILRADPDAQLATLLSPAAMRANPFLRGKTAADLIAKSARDIATEATATAGVTPQAGAASSKGSGPQVKVRCNLGLASCQKWLALHKAKLKRTQARVAATGADKD
jgi:hypothetical protein